MVADRTTSQILRQPLNTKLWMALRNFNEKKNGLERDLLNLCTSKTKNEI